MLPADYPFELRPPRRSRWPLHGRRVFAVWISLCVHLGILLHLLQPAQPMPELVRLDAGPSDRMQVILLDRVLEPTAQQVVARNTFTEAAKRPRTASLQRPSVPPSIAETSVAPTPTAADAARLFGSIEGAAEAVVAGDPRRRDAGMPSAMARLPGSTDAIVDLPVHFKRRVTPKQITLVALRILVATMAGHPDDMESVGNLRSPLKDLTDTHMRNIKEPECNDPDDPLRDPRCAIAPQR